MMAIVIKKMMGELEYLLMNLEEQYFERFFLGNTWHLQQEAWQPALQQGGCVIIGLESKFQLKYTLDSTRLQVYIKSFLSLDPPSITSLIKLR